MFEVVQSGTSPWSGTFLSGSYVYLLTPIDSDPVTVYYNFYWELLLWKGDLVRVDLVGSWFHKGVDFFVVDLVCMNKKSELMSQKFVPSLCQKGKVTHYLKICFA